MTDMQIRRDSMWRRQHHTTQQNACTEEKNNPMGCEIFLSKSAFSGLLARSERILLHGEG